MTSLSIRGAYPAKMPWWTTTFLFTTPEDRTLGLMGMAVDNHKVHAVTNWLTAQDVAFAQVPLEDVPKETKKGLAVFNLVSATIPEQVAQKMTKKFGEVICSQYEYQQQVNSLPNRPKYLKPPALPPPKTAPQALTTATKNQFSPTILIGTTPLNEVKTEPFGVENRPVVSSDHLQNWYNVADKLGKSDQYKQRIMEIAGELDSGQQLSQKALAAMNKDTSEHQSISRLTQIAQRVGMLGGVALEDGSTQVKGKMYDLTFNTDQRDLAIAQKNGEIILSLQSGKVQTNKVTPEVLQTFEQANSQVNQVVAKSKAQGMEI
ncbi:hypothetical protein FNW02_37910 [Komarekiella sp. 'clone 1']|uniref:Uncharacterized protein n=1 Tax=Komarekiella delphini-convector SJRDD-AB1 TaxID=2593771 RepID=A0AA41BAQ0_9NOST|nr:hypothetical protein [Komarekiella delphini-convector SJRDD-AB1]